MAALVLSSDSGPGAGRGRPIRILVVDDDPLTRLGLRTILATEPDMEVVGEAGDAAGACRLTVEAEPDVVLMDVQLPDVDGIDATTRILGQARTAPPRVLVLTTFDVDE